MQSNLIKTITMQITENLESSIKAAQDQQKNRLERSILKTSKGEKQLVVIS